MGSYVPGLWMSPWGIGWISPWLWPLEILYDCDRLHVTHQSDIHLSVSSPQPPISIYRTGSEWKPCLHIRSTCAGGRVSNRPNAQATLPNPCHQVLSGWDPDIRIFLMLPRWFHFTAKIWTAAWHIPCVLFLKWEFSARLSYKKTHIFSHLL